MSDTGIYLRPLPKVGQEVGRFLIEKELPRGGQARVYRAWQLDLQRPVALKLLPASFATDGDALVRFQREIENVAKVTHPNVVHVYEAGELDGHAFFTMEFIEGQDTETMLKKGPLDADAAAALIEAIARGVQQAHAKGIVHRDIKPGNIILRHDDTPVLTDFGLAQDLRHSNQLTQTGVSMGTPAYMSPEQARGERARVGVRSDVYALGATLFTLLTGKRPVEGDSAYELMVKVAESQGPKWPRMALEDVPRDLRAIVERAMQNDPGKRYESARDLADDLERFLRGDWVVARSRGAISRLYARVRRYVPAAAVIVLAIGVAAGIVYSDLTLPDTDPVAELDSRRLIPDNLPKEDFERLFTDTGGWTKHGATVSPGQGNEMLMTRQGDGPLLISPPEKVCWGDFTLQTQLRVQEQAGALALLVGMPSGGGLADAAYAISISDGARDQFVLYRLGVPVFSGQRADGQLVITPGRWQAATITRQAQVLSFSLTDVQTGAVALVFEYQDDFPALLSDNAEVPRQRFGILADVAQLDVRNVTVAHRDHRYTNEELLFAYGQYAEVERRVSARISAPLPADAAPEQRNERARLHYLRARCYIALDRADDALADCAQTRTSTDDATLRALASLLAGRIHADRGDDDAALASWRAASFSAGPGPVQARVFHQAASYAHKLPGDRALRFHDYVASSALGTPALVGQSLLAAARIRAGGDAAQAAAARGALRRLSGAGYTRFGAQHAPAIVMLFEQRITDLLALAPAAQDEPLAADEVRTLAAQIEAAIDGWGVDNALLVPPLVRTSLLLRLQSEPGDIAAWRRAGELLRSARRATTRPGEDLWVELHLALLLEERPQFATAEQRLAAWQALADQAEGNAALSAIADFFLGTPADDADAARRLNLLRLNLRRELAGVAAHWLADAEVDRFADYLAGVFHAAGRRAHAATLLERSALEGSGLLALLKGRAEAWLPPER